MGKTYQKQPKRFEDELTSGRSGKHSKRSGGMKTLNSYVDDDYDSFDDEVELTDEIQIQHTKNIP